MHFEIVFEPAVNEEKLYAAIERFRAEFSIRADAPDIMREVQGVAASVPSVFETDAWATLGCELGLREATARALRDLEYFRSPRKARQEAKSIWSPRQNRRGRNQEIDLQLLSSILTCVEKIANRKFSYKRQRFRRAPVGSATTGPPEGSMLEVLIAAIDWANCVLGPKSDRRPIKAEGVISAIKRMRWQNKNPT